MVVIRPKVYLRLPDVEYKLDEADRQAEETTGRLTHEEVFSKIRERANKIGDATDNAL